MTPQKIKAVFDIDETICSAVNRDYVNAAPKEDVIKKINHLHDDLGFEISLYTSRGMVSCHGDLNWIKEKNEKILVEWLKKNNVHYDTLIFGKPIADFYVDDKGISLNDFINNDYEVLKGGSGKSVFKLGNMVKKEIASSGDLIGFQCWQIDNKGYCKTPKVSSYLYNAVYMEYIKGHTLKDELSRDDFCNIIYTIDDFSKVKYDSFNLDRQLTILRNNFGIDKYINPMISFCEKELKKYESFLNDNASFSHGDMTLSNIIHNDLDNEIYFIDSRYFRDSSSYLLDYAKLKMSMDGYEYKFNLSCNKPKKKLKKEFIKVLEIKGILKIVTLLELMYVLRLFRYKNNDEREIVKKFAEKVLKKYEKLS